MWDSSREDNARLARRDIFDLIVFGHIAKKEVSSNNRVRDNGKANQ